MKIFKIRFLQLVLTAVILATYGFSCVRLPSAEVAPEKRKQNNFASKFDSLTIQAINLSEDMSRLSTKNDEIFLFIYDYSDTSQLNAPLVSKKFIFDENNKTHSVLVPTSIKIILFCIEEDSFRNMEQIEPVVRVYFKEIMKANGYEELKKYLGDDDLLGIQIIESNTKEFKLEGSSSLDKFEYKFRFK